MNPVRFPRHFRVYFALLALAVVLVFLLPKSVKFNYDYRRGSQWMYEDVVAAFDFPILKTEDQIIAERDALSAENVPYYRKSANVASEAIRNTASIALDSLAAQQEVRSAIMAKLTSIYEKGVVASKDQMVPEGLVFVQKDKRANKVPVSEIYTVDEAKVELCSAINSVCPNIDADSLCVATLLYEYLLPDLSFDAKTTELVRYSSANYVSTTEGVQPAGTVIVRQGEIVTAEIEQVLDSYKAEFNQSIGYQGNEILMWIGNVLVSLLLVALLFFVILFTNEHIFEERSRFYYLIMLYLLSSLAALLTDKYGPQYLYMVPFTLIALYMLAFFRKRVVLPFYIISLLPLLIFAHNGPQLFVMFLAAGIVNIFSFTYFNRGWLQFVNAFCSFLTLVFVWIIFQLFDGATGILDYEIVIKLFLGSLFCVAGYPFIYLFEKMFRLVSKNRLQELCDTNNNSLLKELAQKAPGTFQHSLQVMSMCERAARAIDTDVELVRAGAMYHDIGKIEKPECFVENTDGVHSFHEGRSPLESAKYIIRHVDAGLEKAEKHGLPGIVREYIDTHHGTTCARYFYDRYLAEGGSPDSAEAKEFFYHGHKPVSKGQVILMCCDSIEAASRSLRVINKETLEALVDKIIDGKIAEGQLSESVITMRDINIVRAEIKQYLLEVNHPRISYGPEPEPEKAKEPVAPEKPLTFEQKLFGGRKKWRK